MKVLHGGLPAWKKAGFPVVSEAEALGDVLSEQGAVVTIDLRDESQQGMSHIPGAVSMPAEQLSQHLTRLPTDKNAPIVLYGSDSKAVFDSFSLIREAGYFNTTILNGGITRWKELGLSVASGPISREVEYESKPKEGVVAKEDFLGAVSAKSSNILLLDVRSDVELGEGVVSGTLHIPAAEVIDRLGEIPVDKDIYVYCKSGVRAEMIYILLKQKGYDVKYLDMNLRVNGGVFELQPKG